MKVKITQIVVPVESITVGDKTVEIVSDDMNSDSPREWDNMGTILYCSDRYGLGDKNVSSEEIKETAKRDDIEHLPVYAYIHSGITISTGPFSCQFDSGQCGIIFVTHEDIIKEYGELTEETKEKARQCLQGEIETFDQYLRGDIYGYVVLDNEGYGTDDSCYGFYGLECAMDEARAAIS